MANNILKCNKCGRYTLDKHCSCGGDCLSVRPARYSPEDKYGTYRFNYKKQLTQ